MGKHNDVHTVDFRWEVDLVIIKHINRNAEPKKQKVLSKNLIKQELAKVGIDRVAFNI
jgi:hypothetical protein